MKFLNLVAVILSVLVGQTAWAETRYTVTDLGTLGGDYSKAYGINNSGQVVGWAITSSGKYHAFLWQSGSGMQDLGALGGSESEAYGINDNGQVVGRVYANGNTLPHAFVWQSSDGMQDIGTLAGGRYSEAYGINRNGQVVGSSECSTGQHAFLWQDGSGMQDLGTLGYSYSSANGINSNGQVVGSGYTSSNQCDAYLWQSGKGMQDLGGASSVASSINIGGQVVGVAYSKNTTSFYTSGRAFLWQDGSGMQDLGTLGGDSSEAFGINDNGWVVGDYYTLITSSSFDRHPFLYDGSTMRDLNDLVASSSGWTLYDAMAINNQGWIVGSGGNANGEWHAFLLTPVPEPCSFILFGVAAISLFAYAWRRRRQAA